MCFWLVGRRKKAWTWECGRPDSDLAQMLVSCGVLVFSHVGEAVNNNNNEKMHRLVTTVIQGKCDCIVGGQYMWIYSW